jgi:hypothetical protein
MARDPRVRPRRARLPRSEIGTEDRPGRHFSCVAVAVVRAEPTAICSPKELPCPSFQAAMNVHYAPPPPEAGRMTERLISRWRVATRSK